MAVLEGLVIAALVVAGAYVGYHAWQDSFDAEAGGHSVEAEAASHDRPDVTAQHYVDIDLRHDTWPLPARA